MPNYVKFKKLSDTATIPTRGTPQSAGLDLVADEKAVLRPGKYQLIQTNIAVELPEGTVGMIRPRSGLAVKYGIDTLAGVIDADFRNSVGVVLINHGRERYDINKGDRIAQLLIQPVEMLEPIEVDVLDTTERTGGWGSTGA